MKGSAKKLASAVVKGEVGRVATLLAADPDLATATIGKNPRSMLHYATDWPANRPNVATSIGLLIAAGADPNVTMPPNASGEVAEMPLHWAASANDVDAVEALIDHGANVDCLGGLFGGCTPYEEAIIFGQYDAARSLLARGATNYLPGAAALGQAELIDSFFDAKGNLTFETGVLPHWNPLPPKQTIVDRAFQFACRSGHLEIAKKLLSRGADPFSSMPGDSTALSEATENGHTEVVAWLEGLAP